MQVDYQYLVAKLQHALANDPRVNALDLKVMISSGRVHLTGRVETEERRLAISEVVIEHAPGMDIRNEVDVLEIGAPGHAEAIVD